MNTTPARAPLLFLPIQRGQMMHLNYVSLDIHLLTDGKLGYNVGVQHASEFDTRQYLLHRAIKPLINVPVGLNDVF